MTVLIRTVEILLLTDSAGLRAPESPCNGMICTVTRWFSRQANSRSMNLLTDQLVYWTIRGLVSCWTAQCFQTHIYDN